MTVVGSVASGAEIIAGGSIHIYGALRGQSFGGRLRQRARPDFLPPARGELMAIDGHYVVADQIEPHLREACIQAWLDKDALEITTMD